MTIEYVRAFRTPSSERYWLRYAGADFACLDLHYLPNATVQAMLVLYEDSTRPTGEVMDILKHIDDLLLPEVSLEDMKLLYTVFAGRSLGAFQPPTQAPPLIDEDA